MRFDLLVVAVLLVFGAIGLVSGAIKQLANLFGMVLAYLACNPLAERLTPFAVKQTGLPASVARVGLSVVLFSLIYAVAAGVVHLLVAKLLPKYEKSKPDRAVGFVLGTAKAGAVAFAIFSAFLMIFPTPPENLPGLLADIKDSRIMAFVGAHNLFTTYKLPQLATVQKLMDAAKNPQAAQDLLKDPQIQAMMNDPSVKSQLNSPDVNSLLQSPEIQKLMSDPAVQAQIKQLQAGQLPAGLTAPTSGTSAPTVNEAVQQQP